MSVEFLSFNNNLVHTHTNTTLKSLTSRRQRKLVLHILLQVVPNAKKKQTPL